MRTWLLGLLGWLVLSSGACLRSGFQSGACWGVTCEGHGTCTLDALGRARCACDPGYAPSAGLHCIADPAAMADASLLDRPGASDSGAIDRGVTADRDLRTDGGTTTDTLVVIEDGGPGSDRSAAPDAALDATADAGTAGEDGGASTWDGSAGGDLALAVLQPPVEIPTPAEVLPAFEYGEDVSISGTWAMVTAPGLDLGGFYPGGFYIFRFDGTTWQPHQRIDDAWHGLGQRVDVDGSRAVVAIGSEDAVLYELSGDTWTERDTVYAGEEVIAEVAIQGDDVATIYRITQDHGGGYLTTFFRLSSAGGWTRESGAGDRYGYGTDAQSFAIELDRGWAVVHIPGVEVRVYERTAAASWQLRGGPPATLATSRNIAIRNPLPQAPPLVAVGDPLANTGVVDGGEVRLYRWDEGTWELEAVLQPLVAVAGARFGTSVSFASDHVLAVSAPGDSEGALATGAVFTFGDTGAGWEQLSRLVPGLRGAGDAVGQVLHATAHAVIVSAPGVDGVELDVGAAYLCELGPLP